MKRLLLALLLASPAFAATPPWMRDAMARPHSAGDADAVVLLDHVAFSVYEDGTLGIHQKRVVKILTTAGREHARAGVWLDGKRSRLHSFSAWSIDARGHEYELKQRDAIEATPADFMLYTDARYKVFHLPAVAAGTVIAYEYDRREQPYLPLLSWDFQEEIPVAQARVVLTMPAGWSYDIRWMNHPPVAPNGNVWTIENIPAVADESRRPAAIAVAGRAGFQFIRPSAKTLTWSDIASWYGRLAAERAISTAPLTTKVRELTANNADPLRALARFAQRDVRYVAVEIGIGGYQPHAAGDVFKNRFGDCKDKATLLRTMLKEAGVGAYDVLVHTTRGATDPAFPSLAAFNHVISALPVTAEQAKSFRAVIDHPRLGKLLLFDPTSTLTPVGELPNYLQASRGLLVTPDGGELIDLPALPPDANQLRRTARLQLDTAGTLTGTVEEVRSGAIAAGMRAMLQPLPLAERVRSIETMLASHFGSYSVAGIAIKHLDDPERDLVIRYDVTARAYAKIVAGMLLVRPRVLGQKGETVVDATKRSYAYMTDGPSLHVDDMEIRLPAGATLDELPAKAEITAPAVNYSSASTFENGVLRYRRRYEVTAFEVAREALPDLNRATTKIAADERASAVFR